MYTKDCSNLLVEHQAVELLEKLKKRQDFLDLLSNDHLAEEMFEDTSFLSNDPEFFIRQLKDTFKKLPVPGFLNTFGIDHGDGTINIKLLEESMEDYHEYDLIWISSSEYGKQHIGYIRKPCGVTFDRTKDEMEHEFDLTHPWIFVLDDDIHEIARNQIFNQLGC